MIFSVCQIAYLFIYILYNYFEFAIYINYGKMTKTTNRFDLLQAIL